MASYQIRVNGSERVVDVLPDTPLLWVLRDSLRLTGTKYACGMALCGACTVHLDGAPVRSCVTSIGEVGGKAITTIEGLAPDSGHPVQKAWIAEEVAQCGYCQSGQIMSAAALLARTPDPSDAGRDGGEHLPVRDLPADPPRDPPRGAHAAPRRGASPPFRTSPREGAGKAGARTRASPQPARS